ncbi:MAG: DUF2961 domain-containing protein [Armatimonadota bacterium]|nr:DUF2961 domain-containing protein [Armatimonadota bacterium]
MLDDKGILGQLTRVQRARTLRSSSWDQSGRNGDAWRIEPGQTAVLADLKGPGCITHIWMTQGGGTPLRDAVLKIYWDDETEPSVLAPLGDFFCLGHGILHSFQSLPFTVSVNEAHEKKFGTSCALNCYLQMPFRKAARIEIENQAKDPHWQYFYVDYELYEDALPDDVACLHAQFHRENPCDGWGHEIMANSPECDIVNKEKLAWDNNYVILEAKGRGHYIGCNMAVTNLQAPRRSWWGEGDDMIWIDGYKWPPDLHGTGSEDYFNQAYGMQPNAYLMNGSSLWEHQAEGYQTSYVFHLTNPMRFEKEIKVTIEHGHGNHLGNDVSSVAYWYQIEPHKPFGIVPVEQRRAIKREMWGKWIEDPTAQTPHKKIKLNDEMKEMKKKYAQRMQDRKR